jgi:amino-acid N-acetyltransferase
VGVELKLRKARNSDVGQIRQLINSMALRTDEDYKHGHMLPRSLNELYEHIRDYTVLSDANGRIFGCCALESQWDGLAELKAMAIADEVQGQGWGRRLVEHVIAECDELGIDCVYLLTNKMEFFARLGFTPIDMRELPQRVWSECTNCPKFMVACDEVAMTYRGQRPRQTFIPAVGVHASPAARAALGLTSASGAGNAKAGPEVNDDAVKNGNAAPPSPGAQPRNGHRMGPMNSDGHSPPFRPHTEE